MDKSDKVVVLVTTETMAEAQKIADALLAEKQVACVNIIPRVDSFFWWEGKIDSAEEKLLILKTKATLLDAIVKTVKQLHSYTVPEIIALPIIAGNEDYLNWIDEEVAA